MNFDIQSKIYPDFEAFEPTLIDWKNNKETIVFTNGCFDIIHHGHVDSLKRAAEYGTKLIVGLNSDSSVELLKGRNRPIFNIDARATILSAFVFVDAIIVFSDETPADLIARIIPQVLVKGKEYEIHEIAGFDTVLNNGGLVKTLELVEGASTTEIIQRIKELDK